RANCVREVQAHALPVGSPPNWRRTHGGVWGGVRASSSGRFGGRQSGELRAHAVRAHEVQGGHGHHGWASPVAKTNPARPPRPGSFTLVTLSFSSARDSRDLNFRWEIPRSWVAASESA